MEEKYIAAIEIGSSHIRAAVGTVDDTGALTLLAVEEEHAVDVVRYGIVQNVDEVSNRIKRLILRLENYPSISPRKIKGVYIGIGGRSTASTSREVIRQFDEETDITAHIVDQIKEEAKANGLTERTVIDVLPKDFIVDNLECPNPVGTLGKSIRADHQPHHLPSENIAQPRYRNHRTPAARHKGPFRETDFHSRPRAYQRREETRMHACGFRSGDNHRVNLSGRFVAVSCNSPSRFTQHHPRCHDAQQYHRGKSRRTQTRTRRCHERGAQFPQKRL